MKVLYIGQYTYGTTSRMRAEVIKTSKIVSNFDYIDTNVPFNETYKIFRSIGFRYKLGPLIKNINSFIIDKIINKRFDLVWVDKGIFITPETINYVKSKTDLLIHYTPDTAFYENQSHLFERGISFYNYLISTKSFEKDIYLKYVDESKILLTTQGYHQSIHKPYYSFNEKDGSIAFIGLQERSREVVIKKLIYSGLKVKLAGFGWKTFISKNKVPNLIYLGEKLVGEEYAKTISSSYFSLGALSKRFPELHTTRTFEIPACGTALLTERNSETNDFYCDDEVIFFTTEQEMIDKILFYEKNKVDLERLINKGTNKVEQYSYSFIINGLLAKVIA